MKNKTQVNRGYYFNIPSDDQGKNLNADMTKALTSIIFNYEFGHISLNENWKNDVKKTWMVWCKLFKNILKTDDFLEIEKYIPFQNVFIDQIDGIHDFDMAVELMMSQIDAYKDDEEIIKKLRIYVVKIVSKIQKNLNKFEYIIDITTKEKDLKAITLNPSFDEVEGLYFNGHFETSVQKARDILSQRHKQINNVYKYFETQNNNLLSKELNSIMGTITTLRNKLFKNESSDELVESWNNLTQNQKGLFSRLMIDLIKLIENQILIDDSKINNN